MVQGIELDSGDEDFFKTSKARRGSYWSRQIL